jgi:hypothetical protein
MFELRKESRELQKETSTQQIQEIQQQNDSILKLNIPNRVSAIEDSLKIAH